MNIEDAAFYSALGKFLSISAGPFRPVLPFPDHIEGADLEQARIALRILRFAPQTRGGSASVSKSCVEWLTGEYLSQASLEAAAFIMGFGYEWGFSAQWVKALSALSAVHRNQRPFAPLPPGWEYVPQLRVKRGSTND